MSWKRQIAIGVLIASLVIPTFVNAQDTTHFVQPGENLYRIAIRYGLTTQDLATANGIVNPARILVGQSIIIPSSNTPTDIVEEPAADTIVVVEETAPTEPEGDEIYHTVARGDQMRWIAQTYSTTVDDIVAWNGIENANRIFPGQVLLVGYGGQGRNLTVEADIAPIEESSPDAEDSTDQTHVVQSGEYLSSIARRYGVPWTVIVAANGITNPNTLYAGQSLIIPGGYDVEVAGASFYAEPGARIGTGREIVVDLSNSMAYAYENGELVYEALGSMGLPATPTVTGHFRVVNKVRSQTMSGPGYWLPNVEWVMYFYAGYALHGAYWHENFGNPMSHGCVNLTNEDALWFYEFAQVGTPVTVQL